MAKADKVMAADMATDNTEPETQAITAMEQDITLTASSPMFAD